HDEPQIGGPAVVADLRGARARRRTGSIDRAQAAGGARARRGAGSTPSAAGANRPAARRMGVRGGAASRDCRDQQRKRTKAVEKHQTPPVGGGKRPKAGAEMTIGCAVQFRSPAAHARGDSLAMDFSVAYM